MLLDPHNGLGVMAEVEKKAFLVEVVDVLRLHMVFLDLFLQLWRGK